MFAQNDLLAQTGKLHKFALRLAKNKPDADDLLQATCLRALEKADCFEDGSNLFGWTSKIMFNIYISGYNRRAKFESKYDPEPYIEKTSVAPAQEASVELALVKEAMMKLSADHREILVLVCVKGMLYQEVSEMLQIPVGTVRSRISRAREELQAIMDKPSVPTYIASHALQGTA